MSGDVEALFRREFARLVRTLALAFDAEAAADAVQEAFLAADRRWAHVSDLDDPAAWVRRVALNRLLNGRRNRRRRQEILAGIRPVVVDDLSVAHLDLHRALRELPERMRLTISACTTSRASASTRSPPTWAWRRAP